MKEILTLKGFFFTMIKKADIGVPKNKAAMKRQSTKS